MSDLISRKDAIKIMACEMYSEAMCHGLVSDTDSPDMFIPEATAWMNDAPSADRPTGEWVLKDHLWECDQCGCRTNRANPLKGNIWNYDYCPNCGADMRQEKSQATVPPVTIP